jgi:IS5 family transposase
MNMAKASKMRASKLSYSSQKQMTLSGFETPFAKELAPTNRWVLMEKQIDWDKLVGHYTKNLKNQKTGASSINPRVVIGSMIIKHHCKLTDEETVMQIQENMYMQYFLGFSSFNNERPFDSSLFVEFRKRLKMEDVQAMTESIAGVDSDAELREVNLADTNLDHKGDLLVDATVCPQNITYPTDLDLLNTGREKLEFMIDFLRQDLSLKAPRIYKKNARKAYLKLAQSKKKNSKNIRSAIRKQLNYIKRNLKHIHHYLDKYSTIPFARIDYKDFMVIQTMYDQQKYMFDNRVNSIADRIVSIAQPHVRPMVRGKKVHNVEFGAKINVSLVNGYTFIERLSWDAFNEGKELIICIENYVRKFGFLPKRVLADQIYCNRENRRLLKEYGVALVAKALGRPSKQATQNRVSPGERNPIEGKFGEAKTRYGLGKIYAKLQNTSESWIAFTILVLNLANLSRRVLLCLYFWVFKQQNIKWAC